MHPIWAVRLAMARFAADCYFISVGGFPGNPIQVSVGRAVRAWRRILRRRKQRYEDYVLGQFVRNMRQHYGDSGRAYSHLSSLTSEGRSTRYADQRSRFEPVVDILGDSLGLRNGDAFLDLGCGTGQNIHFLKRRFPDSLITGVDLNDGALKLIEEHEGSDRLVLLQGDLLDEHFVEQVLVSGADHIILSHVFSLLFSENRNATHAMRRDILAKLAGAARKSLTVIDSLGAHGDFGIEIEQRDRLLIRDNVLAHLTELGSGSVVLTQTKSSNVIVFRRLV